MKLAQYLKVTNADDTDVRSLKIYAALHGASETAEELCSQLAPTLVERSHRMKADDDRWLKRETEFCGGFFACFARLDEERPVNILGQPLSREKCVDDWVNAFARSFSTPTLVQERRTLVEGLIAEASTSVAQEHVDALVSALKEQAPKTEPEKPGPPEPPRRALDLGYAPLRISEPPGELTYDLLVGKTEVTNEQYQVCVNAGVCPPPFVGPAVYNWERGVPMPLSDVDISKKLASNASTRPRRGRENHPVNGVHQPDAMRFCQWAGATLPRASQWDGVAATVGEPWSVDEVAKNARVSSTGAPILDATAAVCSKGAGRTSICDLWGNVWEWTATTYELPRDAVTPGGYAYILKGGSFTTSLSKLALTPTKEGGEERPDVGFRCVVEYPDAILLSGKDWLRLNYMDKLSSCTPTDEPDGTFERDCAIDCRLGSLEACQLLASAARLSRKKATASTAMKVAGPALNQACTSGGALAACESLAELREASGDADGAAAVRQTALAASIERCRARDYAACAAVGHALVIANKPGAEEPLRIACKAGVARACADLALAYALGIGAPIDKAREARFFDMACSFGDRSSCGRGRNAPRR